MTKSAKEIKTLFFQEAGIPSREALNADTGAVADTGAGAVAVADAGAGAAMSLRASLPRPET
jgi:hypothetical protein